MSLFSLTCLLPPPCFRFCQPPPSLSASLRIPRRPRGPGPGPGPAGPPSPPSATTSSPDPGRRPARLPQGCPLRPRCAFLTDCRETKLVTFPSATCDPAPRKGLLPRLTSVPRSPPLALGDPLFRWKLRHRPRLQDPPLLPPRASLRSPPFPPPSRLPSLLCPALRLSLGWSQFCSPGCVGSRWHPEHKAAGSTVGQLYFRETLSLCPEHLASFCSASALRRWAGPEGNAAASREPLVWEKVPSGRPPHPTPRPHVLTLSLFKDKLVQGTERPQGCSAAFSSVSVWMKGTFEASAPQTSRPKG